MSHRTHTTAHFDNSRQGQAGAFAIPHAAYITVWPASGSAVDEAMTEALMLARHQFSEHGIASDCGEFSSNRGAGVVELRVEAKAASYKEFRDIVWAVVMTLNSAEDADAALARADR